MQSRNKARIEELEIRSGTNESKTLAVEWIRGDEIFIEYNGDRYEVGEFKRLYPSVKVLTLKVVG